MIRRIIAYKDDLGTTDLVCVEFELQNSTVYLAHEEAPGFEELAQNMAVQFQEIDPDWFIKVMQPAFARNLTVLFERNA